MSLIEGEDSRGPMFELRGEDRFCPIDEEERRFASRLGCCHADRPEYGLELVEPALATGYKLLAEASCLEALEDLSVSMLGLAVDSRVRHGGVADLRAKAGAV